MPFKNAGKCIYHAAGSNLTGTGPGEVTTAS